MLDHAPSTDSPTAQFSDSPLASDAGREPSDRRREPKLELSRLARLREQLHLAGCDAGVFFDPINVRYATGTSNMQGYSLHNPCRYVYVPVVGPVVLFEFKGCEHLSLI